jgi:hypothetical protein
LSVARSAPPPPVEPAVAAAADESRPSTETAIKPAATSGAIVPAAEPAPGPAPETAAPMPSALPASSAAATGTSAPETSAAADRLTVVLAARRPVWISATVDGRKALGRLLQTGEQETIEVAREMVITAGDAAAVKVTLNGAEARPIGKTGEVVTVRFTPANSKDYVVSR